MTDEDQEKFEKTIEEAEAMEVLPDSFYKKTCENKNKENVLESPESIELIFQKTPLAKNRNGNGSNPSSEIEFHKRDENMLVVKTLDQIIAEINVDIKEKIECIVRKFNYIPVIKETNEFIENDFLKLSFLDLITRTNILNIIEKQISKKYRERELEPQTFFEQKRAMTKLFYQDFFQRKKIWPEGLKLNHVLNYIYGKFGITKIFEISPKFMQFSEVKSFTNFISLVTERLADENTEFVNHNINMVSETCFTFCCKHNVWLEGLEIDKNVFEFDDEEMFRQEGSESQETNYSVFPCDTLPSVNSNSIVTDTQKIIDTSIEKFKKFQPSHVTFDNFIKYSNLKEKFEKEGLPSKNFEQISKKIYENCIKFNSFGAFYFSEHFWKTLYYKIPDNEFKVPADPPFTSTQALPTELVGPLTHNTIQILRNELISPAKIVPETLKDPEIKQEIVDISSYSDDVEIIEIEDPAETSLNVSGLDKIEISSDEEAIEKDDVSKNVSRDVLEVPQISSVSSTDCSNNSEYSQQETLKILPEDPQRESIETTKVASVFQEFSMVDQHLRKEVLSIINKVEGEKENEKINNGIQRMITFLEITKRKLDDRWNESGRAIKVPKIISTSTIINEEAVLESPFNEAENTPENSSEKNLIKMEPLSQIIEIPENIITVDSQGVDLFNDIDGVGPSDESKGTKFRKH